MFFDPRRYDLAKVGRYKFNKKLHLRNRISGQIAGRGCRRHHHRRDPGRSRYRGRPANLADKIQNAAVPYLWIQGEERKIKVLSNLMVDLKSFVDVDPEEAWGYRVSILSGSGKNSGRIHDDLDSIERSHP